MSNDTTRKRRSRPPSPPLLSLRLLVLSGLVAVVVAALTWSVSGDSVAAAILAGLSAGGVTLDRLHLWTEP